MIGMFHGCIGVYCLIYFSECIENIVKRRKVKCLHCMRLSLSYSIKVAG